MHIKQVIIAGFRSYKDQLEVAPFSSKHNVVVGRNGSGKSNFFDAICFVLLSSKFANLRQDERQQLLHEGAGANVMSAFVEIIFDNSDGRFPVDHEEVVLRRTIGLKKDEFFLNRKHIAKGDVIHLLESAGFSRSNPYYIVQQGKVQALALMKERDRLDLLKEVAGTRVYEERREESMKILLESNSKREKIQEVIAYIEERLKELEEEKEELKEYQSLDKKKRALEYTLYEKELDKTKEQLQEIEDLRHEEVQVSNEMHNKALELHEAIRNAERTIKADHQQLKAAQQEKEVLEASRYDLIQQRAKLELEVRELDENVEADNDRQQRLKQEMKSLDSQIKVNRRKLEQEVLPQFNSSREALEGSRERLSNFQRQAETLYAKQGRNANFKTREERDRFLQGEISELEGVIDTKRENIASLQSSIKALEKQISEQSVELQEQQEDMGERFQHVESLIKRSEELKQELNRVAEHRKEAWSREQQLSKQTAVLKEQIKNAEDELRSTMPRDVRLGLQAIEQIAAEQNLSGIYGPLYSVLELERDAFRRAVEVVAGNSLFHVVVDTDETASKIMRVLERQNRGRVTFMPLNRLRTKEQNYPQTDDVVPLISKLRFKPLVRPAIQAVFGKALLCRNLDVAAKYAESAKMDCLTLDGDMVQRRGAMQGGYIDPQKSRLAAAALLKISKSKLADLEPEIAKTKSQVEQTDQAVTRLMSEKTRVDHEKTRARESHGQLTTSFKRLRDAIKSQEAFLAERRTQLEASQRSLRESEAHISSLQQELGTDLTASLTSGEREQLRTLQIEMDDLKQRIVEQQVLVEEVRAQKSQLETVLNSNLLRRYEEAEAELGTGVGRVDVSERIEKHDSKRDDLTTLVESIRENNEAIRQADETIMKLEASIRKTNQALEDLKVEDAGISETLQSEARKADKLLNKRSMLTQKREDTIRKIRELGTLPMLELEKYKNYNLNKVMKELHTCNDNLKKYSHVNKKALDQYVNFSEQRSALIDRKKELDDGASSIQELIEVLDQRKDEAILRTFKGVSHHFTEVFKELVPEGHGQITILRSADESSQATQSEGRQQHRVSSFEGVQVKVSFTGGGETYLMQQLSGGQKAVVALAFIFAIQRCDPAPFYLFDEIDQALDSTYRAAVAALIQRQTNDADNPAQFITSTFRPELVSAADRFYGIGHQNKVSDVHEMQREDALEFIKSIMAEEEAVGPVQAPTNRSSIAKPA